MLSPEILLEKKPHLSMRAILQMPENMAYINKEVITNTTHTKKSLAQHLCEQFSFMAPNGKLKIKSCEAVLGDFLKKKLITVPIVRSCAPYTFTSMKVLNEEFPLPTDMPDVVDTIKNEIEIILIGEKDSKKKLIWNTLIAKDHPLGTTRPSGYSVKYLITWKGCYIGAACFSSSSFNLDHRTDWMGWSKADSEEFKQQVINMSRFLIRREINCRNLASFLLSKLINLIKIDFNVRYGISPWIVESFIDTSSHAGTCYQAANWLCIGQSTGRGRNDRKNEYAKTIKDIYVYVLEPNFRKIGNFKPKKEEFPRLEVYANLTEKAFSEKEFEGIDLGDKRLEKRLVKIAETKANAPFLSFPKAAGGEKAEIAAYYNFLSNDNEEINEFSIMSGHRKATICRMLCYPTVLSIQDSSDFNFSGLNETKGLGVIGKNKGSNGTLGMRLHSKISIAPKGLMLGCTSAEFNTRDKNNTQTRAERDLLPYNEKESYRWYKGLVDDFEMSKKMPGTRIISVMDAEADDFNLLKYAHEKRDSIGVVIRSTTNREIVGSKLKLHDSVSAVETFIIKEIDIPAQRARKATANLPARPYVKPRIATVEIKYLNVEIQPPSRHAAMGEKPIPMTIVYTSEPNPPPGSEKIDWYLLTTEPVNDGEDAYKVTEYYKQRWKIEDYYKVVKSGGNAEDHKLDSYEKLKKALAIDLVVATRIMATTHLSRHHPELPASVAFNEDEIEMLSTIASTQPRLKIPVVISIIEAIKIVAGLGGYLNRKSDPPPGNERIWSGLHTLSVMLIGAKMLRLSQSKKMKTIRNDCLD